MYSTRILVMPVTANSNGRKYLEGIEGEELTEADIASLSAPEPSLNTKSYTLSEFTTLLNDADDTDDSFDVKDHWFGWVIADEYVKEDSIEQKYNDLRTAIGELADDLSEKRSDICEILTLILEKGHWAEKHVYKTESRFITSKVPDGAVLAQYDTYCTEISFQMPDGEWEIGEEHNYED